MIVPISNNRDKNKQWFKWEKCLFYPGKCLWRWAVQGCLMALWCRGPRLLFTWCTASPGLMLLPTWSEAENTTSTFREIGRGKGSASKFTSIMHITFAHSPMTTQWYALSLLQRKLGNSSLFWVILCDLLKKKKKIGSSSTLEGNGRGRENWEWGRGN